METTQPQDATRAASAEPAPIADAVSQRAMLREGDGTALPLYVWHAEAAHAVAPRMGRTG